MENLIVLGTGNAMVTHCFNTCFAVRSGADTLLVDAGGGSGILVQLEKAGIPVTDIHDLIVTHEHCDHILGVVWIVRAIATKINAGKYKGDLTIWCHPGLETAIRAMCGYTLQKKMTAHFGGRIRFAAVSDGLQAELLGHGVQFFSIHSTKAEQYGFTYTLENGKKLVCLGDEPYNPLCEAYVRGAGWMLAEAFCMYGDREKFKPYEKHHSTVMDAAKLAEELGVSNLVLWHTEDSDIAHRKARYTVEGAAYYHGNLFVPDDLDVIALD